MGYHSEMAAEVRAARVRRQTYQQHSQVAEAERLIGDLERAILMLTGEDREAVRAQVADMLAMLDSASWQSFGSRLAVRE